MATKNNPKNKGVSGGKKVINGKELEPIMYDGTYSSHGKYMSAKYTKTNDIVMDSKGIPVKWNNIPLSNS